MRSTDFALPVALAALGCGREAPAPVTANPSTTAPQVAAPSAAPTSPPVVTATSSASAAPAPADGSFEGGPCTNDADCVGFTDCCAFNALCGNKDGAKKMHDLCSCCVSCPAPDKPAGIVPCACVAGRCAKKPATR